MADGIARVAERSSAWRAASPPDELMRASRAGGGDARPECFRSMVPFP
jgi:hypothetical protein